MKIVVLQVREFGGVVTISGENNNFRYKKVILESINTIKKQEALLLKYDKIILCLWFLRAFLLPK